MAVALRLTTFVTNAGAPVTGLAGANLPEVQIRNAGTGAIVQAFTAGAEIGDGFYGFTFMPAAGVNYVALWDRDPAAAGQVTPQERYASASFTESLDDVVPEGGAEDIGTLLQRLDVAVSTRAAPGDAMTLAAGAITAAVLATDAIDADALAADVAVEINAAVLAAISALNDLDQTDVQAALDAQGYTSARAALLDNLDAAISGVAAAVWAVSTTGSQAAGSFGKAVTRLFGANTRTRVYLATAEISTAGRFVPAGAISHMEVDARDDGGSFPGVVYFVVLSYAAGSTATSSPASTTTSPSAPVDGTFSVEPYPS